jgi:hypothetical protein
VWRWSGWWCRAVRSDGRLPFVWHATEEKSIMPPQWCRVLLVPPRRGCRWWLRRWWSLLLGEKTCSFLPWLQHSPPHK